MTKPYDLAEQCAKEIDQLRLNAHNGILKAPPDRAALIINIMFGEELTGMKSREREAARRRIIERLTGFDSLTLMKTHNKELFTGLWHWLKPYQQEGVKTKLWRMNEKQASRVREIWRQIRGNQSQETITLT